MTRSYDSAVKKHYDKVARAEGASPASTMADTIIREKETSFIRGQIAKFIEGEASPVARSQFSVIDVGCGNGHTLSVLSKVFPQASLTGIEFNAAQRAIATKRFARSKTTIKKGDIRLAKTLPRSTFDVLVCQRVIINLLSSADQRTALKNLVGLVRPNGLLLFIECFASGLSNLNAARREFGLSALPEAHHNLYLGDRFFATPRLTEFDLSQRHELSTHYFVSRVLHPWFLTLSGQQFARNSHFVSFFSRGLPDGIGEYAPLRFLAFTKDG